MPYLELSFDLAESDPGRAESVCFERGALCVTLVDAHAAGGRAGDSGAVLEPRPGEVRLWPRTRLSALFAAEVADPALIVALARSLELEPSQLQTRALADRIWEREWLRDFHALRFGRRLWVCPSHETVAQPDAVTVRLDPGLAFGTGTHPSTALCLEWLDGAALSGRRVIDYGSGSGVLAIAALRLGARCVHAFDIDLQALLATRENAARNGVADRLMTCEAERQLPPECDTLLANILSETLLALAPALAARVAAGGSLLLSGILDAQEAEVTARFSAWFDMTRFARREGWVALHGARHGG